MGVFELVRMPAITVSTIKGQLLSSTLPFFVTFVFFVPSW